ncbi:MAG: prolipoprotein diacylglyceryl transferase family protein, partial [Bacteroidota bacterium]
LYEALCYFTIAGILFLLYKKGWASQFKGKLTGLFLALTFTARFLIEFVKENQEAFEDGLALNMGQILSIPLVLFGLYLLLRPQKTES